MIPRAVKRKTGAVEKPADVSAAPVATTSNATAEDTGEQQAAVANVESTPAGPSGTAQDGGEADDKQRKELHSSIMNALDLCLSDFGLSWFRNEDDNDNDKDKDLLGKLKASDDRASVHLQHLLLLPPVRALTDSITDLQRALSDPPCPSDQLKLSKDKFRVVRTTVPDYDQLATKSHQDWLDSSVYLEHIPSLPGQANTAASLRDYFSRLFDCNIMRVILPPIFNPATGESGYRVDQRNSQSAAFKASASAKGKGKANAALPPEGGPYRGFAIVVLDSAEAAKRVIETWPWERSFDEDIDVSEASADPDDNDEDLAEGESLNEKSQPLPDDESLAKKWGLRSLSYARYLELQDEYLAYQEKIANLPDRTYKDRQQRQEKKRSEAFSRDSSRPDPRTVDRWGKAERSPSPPSGSTWQNKKRRRYGDDDNRHGDSRATGSSGKWTNDRYVDDRADAATSNNKNEDNDGQTGAYPKGCVVWVRSLHPSSTRQAIKSYISDMLEEQEEGTGTGVVYVQFEKGLDNAHIRFSSAHLSNLFLGTLASKGPFYALPTSLTPDKPPSAMEEVEPVLAELVTGEREFIYWRSLPERARRVARKSAAGESELATVDSYADPAAGTNDEKNASGRPTGQSKDVSPLKASDGNAAGQEEQQHNDESPPKRK